MCTYNGVPTPLAGGADVQHCHILENLNVKLNKSGPWGLRTSGAPRPTNCRVVTRLFLPLVHLCSNHGEQSAHEALPMAPASDQSFCVFSADNREIFGG